jgi:hypothetical protein
MVEAQRVFVEDDRIAADRFADRAAERRGIERARLGGLCHLGTACVVTFG